MITLGIDCTTGWTNVGISKNGNIVCEVNKELGRRQSSQLSVLTEQLFHDANITLDDLTAVAVAVGPGSYTGIRTGIAYAVSLAEALSLNVVPLSTLELFASVLVKNENCIASVMKARKNYIYCALYTSDGTGLKEIMPESYLEASYFAAKLINYPNAVITGSGAEFFSAAAKLCNHTVLCQYNAGGKAAVYGEKHINNAVSPSALRGNYLRAPDIGPTS